MTALRNQYFDVAYVAEFARAATDLDVLNMAVTQNRIIITEDFDFADLAIRDQHHVPGLVILFLPTLPPAERAERLRLALNTLNFTPDGRLTIVEANRIRVRPLPVTRQD